MTTPPAVKLLAFVALVYALWRLAPEILWTGLLLVGLYLVVTHGERVGAYLSSIPGGLRATVTP